MERMAGGVVVWLYSLGREKGSWAKENPQRAALASACHCCAYGRTGGWALSKWQMWSVKACACVLLHAEMPWYTGGGGRVSNSSWCIVCEHSPAKRRHKVPMHWQPKHLSFCALLRPGWNDHRPLHVEPERINSRSFSSVLVHKSCRHLIHKCIS